MTSKSSAPCICFKTILKLYIIVSLYRLLNALILQTQFDPDEYWQTLEPAYCLAFRNRNCAYTWEWTRRRILSSSEEGTYTYADIGADINIGTNIDIVRHSWEWIQNALEGPVRSHVSILPTFWLFRILKYTKYDTTWMVARGPVLVNALLVAAPTDVATYYIARWMSTSSKDKNLCNIALIATITNWFQNYALVRTYSNSLETMLLTVGIAILCPELFSSLELVFSKKINRDGYRSIRIRPMAKLAFILGGLGVSIRFTSLAAWIPLGIIISLRRVSTGEVWHYLWNLCAFYGALGLFIGCVIDWYFYGFGAVPFLGNFHFNVILGYGNLYGTHPIHWYITAGLPAISGLLFPFFLYEIFQVNKTLRKTKSSKSRVDPKVTLAIVIFSYIMFHSFSSHKEFRFILPILPLVCILAGSAIHKFISCDDDEDDNSDNNNNKASSLRSKRKNIVIISILLNYPVLFYLGMVHQRAPISVNQAISSYIERLERVKNENNIKMDESKEIPTFSYSIHYLMGCHSTPLYSHLHIPSTRTTKSNDNRSEDSIAIDTWTLDCSPECRLNSSCPSDAFVSDPSDFISKTYSSARTITLNHKNSHTSTSSEEDSSCLLLVDEDQDSETTTTTTTCQKDHNHQELHRSTPNFLIIYDNELSSDAVREMIVNKMGLVEVAQFRHGIINATFGDLGGGGGGTRAPSRKSSSKFLPDVYWTNQGLRIQFLGKALDLIFDHMVVFADDKIILNLI